MHPPHLAPHFLPPSVTGMTPLCSEGHSFADPTAATTGTAHAASPAVQTVDGALRRRILDMYAEASPLQALQEATVARHVPDLYGPSKFRGKER